MYSITAAWLLVFGNKGLGSSIQDFTTFLSCINKPSKDKKERKQFPTAKQVYALEVKKKKKGNWSWNSHLRMCLFLDPLIFFLLFILEGILRFPYWSLINIKIFLFPNYSHLDPTAPHVFPFQTLFFPYLFFAWKIQKEWIVKNFNHINSYFKCF